MNTLTNMANILLSWMRKWQRSYVSMKLYSVIEQLLGRKSLLRGCFIGVYTLLYYSSYCLRTWPRNCPAPLARSVPGYILTHAFYHAFTHSARTALNRLSFEMAPSKLFAAPHVEQPPPSQRMVELMEFHKMCNSNTMPKLPCMKLKSRRKFPVSVVNAVGLHHNPL